MMEMMRKKVSKFPLGLKHKGDSYFPKDKYGGPRLESRFEIINETKNVVATNITANTILKDKQTGRIMQEHTTNGGNIPEDSRKDFSVTFYGLEDNKEYEIVVTLNCDEYPEGKVFRQLVSTGK